MAPSVIHPHTPRAPLGILAPCRATPRPTLLIQFQPEGRLYPAIDGRRRADYLITAPTSCQSTVTPPPVVTLQPSTLLIRWSLRLLPKDCVCPDFSCTPCIRSPTSGSGIVPQSDPPQAASARRARAARCFIPPTIRRRRRSGRASRAFRPSITKAPGSSSAWHHGRMRSSQPRYRISDNPILAAIEGVAAFVAVLTFLSIPVSLLWILWRAITG